MNIFQLGEALRKRRKILGVTQTTLADLSGVGLHSISDIESGKGNPTIEVVKKIFAPLGLKLTIQIAKPETSSEKS